MRYVLGLVRRSRWNGRMCRFPYIDAKQTYHMIVKE